jgi:hypothetical protein
MANLHPSDKNAIKAGTGPVDKEKVKGKVKI